LKPTSSTWTVFSSPCGQASLRRKKKSEEFISMNSLMPYRVIGEALQKGTWQCNGRILAYLCFRFFASCCTVHRCSLFVVGSLTICCWAHLPWRELKNSVFCNFLMDRGSLYQFFQTGAENLIRLHSSYIRMATIMQHLCYVCHLRSLC
jgi:hypothetical protein